MQDQLKLVLCMYWELRSLPPGMAHKIPCVFCRRELVIERRNWGFGLAVCAACLTSRYDPKDIEFGGGVVGGVHYKTITAALVATENIFRRN